MVSIACCQGGIRDGETCLGCALHGEPNTCDYPLAMIEEVVHGKQKRGKTGDFSTTELQKCPRFVVLTTGGSDDEDRGPGDDTGVYPPSIYALFRGTMYHRGVEATVQGIPGTDTERRLYKDVVVDGRQYTISGQYDLRLSDYRGGHILEDYKSTGKTTDGVATPDMDYVHQANIYRWLHAGGRDDDGNAYDIDITAYRVWYLANDGVKGFWIDLLPLDEVEEYIRGQIRKFTQPGLPEILPMREYRDRQRKPQRQIDRHCSWCPIRDYCYGLEGLKIDGLRAIPLDEEPKPRTPDPRLADWISGA